jgi:uncharacterized protein YukE
MGDQIQAQPPAILEVAASFSGKSGIADGFKSSVQSATRGLSGSLSGVTELSSFAGAVEEVAGGLGTVMDCFSNALQRTGSGLGNTAQSFKTTDTQLYMTFTALEQALQQFTGFETATPSPTPSPSPGPSPTPNSKPSHPWWDTMFHDIGSGLKWFGKHVIVPVIRRVGEPPKMGGPGVPDEPGIPGIPDIPDIPIPVA